MKGYICGICNYVSINGSAPEKCPVCAAPKTSFTEKDDAIKLPQNDKSLTDPEKKHIPSVTIAKQCGLIPDGCQDIIVKIGDITHPMEEKHFIVHIDFYLDNEYVSRVMLTPKMNPAVTVHYKINTGKVSVISLCNVHGAWIKEANI